jgi:hypothetical protein
MNGHSEQCGFGQRAGHPKDAGWGGHMEKGILVDEEGEGEHWVSY